jgi:hypothetical protein
MNSVGEPFFKIFQFWQKRTHIEIFYIKYVFEKKKGGLWVLKFLTEFTDPSWKVELSPRQSITQSHTFSHTSRVIETGVID